MTENDLKLIGRQVGSKARTADQALLEHMETSKPRDCGFCVHSLYVVGNVVCKLTRMPVSDTRGGCHKYDERINYE